MTTPRILVPLDGSKFAEFAVPTALGLARTLGGTVEFVSVFHQLELISVEKHPVTASVPQVTADQIEASVKEYLDTLVDRIGTISKVSVSAKILRGPVTPTLEEYAEEVRPDLVVMSTHGRGALSRAWLGSVADRIVRHASMPVLLVRPDESDEVALTDEKPFSKIMIALDGSDFAESSLEWAIRVGHAAAARYRVVSMVPPPFPIQSSYLPDVIKEQHRVLDEGKRTAEEYLSQVRARLAQRGVEVDMEVRAGAGPATGILRSVADWDADLIVIASHGHGGLRRAILGSVADKVIRGATVSVLVVRAAVGD